MIPAMSFIIDLPEPLSSHRSIVAMHTRVAKECLRLEALRHHERRFPGKFVRSAHAKYGFVRRKQSWIFSKRNIWGSDTDLVASGRTKRTMLNTSPRLSVAGNADSIRATLRYRFPFPASVAKSTNRVSLAQMILELQTTLSSEVADIANNFKHNYTAQIAHELRTRPRLANRIGT